MASQQRWNQSRKPFSHTLHKPTGYRKVITHSSPNIKVSFLIILDHGIRLTTSKDSDQFDNVNGGDILTLETLTGEIWHHKVESHVTTGILSK